jgi:RNA polymerase sigma factor (sigma-70 family)
MPAAVISAAGTSSSTGHTERRNGVGKSSPPAAEVVRTDLERIFRATYPQVVSIAARVLGSRNEAEDVAQEVFLSFARASVPEGEALRWLSVATAHTALNHIRSGRRRAVREEAAAERHTPPPDVADTVLALESRHRVRMALTQLPHKHATVLVLRHSGFSYAEIAAALNMSPGSVGTTVRRAESALRKEWNSHASS